MCAIPGTAGPQEASSTAAVLANGPQVSLVSPQLWQLSASFGRLSGFYSAEVSALWLVPTSPTPPQENDDCAADGDSIHLDHDMRSPSPPHGVSPAASGAPADGGLLMTSALFTGDLSFLAAVSVMQWKQRHMQYKRIL